MAVSKRTRYEVLRRDDFTCRYCRSKDNELHVDHVTPVSLGGSDKPDNLVAACRDCNAGKASSSPDSGTLDCLTDQQIAYEKARAAVVAREEEAAKSKRSTTTLFRDAWDAVMPTGAEVSGDWKASVAQWSARGLSVHRMIDAIEIAADKDHLPLRALYPYTCKILWNWVTDLEDQIRDEATVTAEGDTDADFEEKAELILRAWDAGHDNVREMYQGEIIGGSILRHHIDGTGHRVPEEYRYVGAA